MKKSELKQMIKTIIEEETSYSSYDVGDIAGKDWDETEVLKFIKKSAKENSKVAESVQFYLDWFGIEKLEDVPETKQFGVYSAIKTKAQTLLGLKAENPKRTIKRKFENEVTEESTNTRTNVKLHFENGNFKTMSFPTNKLDIMRDLHIGELFNVGPKHKPLLKCIDFEVLDTNIEEPNKKTPPVEESIQRYFKYK